MEATYSTTFNIESESTSFGLNIKNNTTTRARHHSNTAISELKIM